MEESELALSKSPAREASPSPPEAESLLAALVYDVSQQVQSVLESMLKLTSSIHQTSNRITEEMMKCKETVEEKRKALDEEKDCVQKAAYDALQMLTAQEFS
ncbi:unnamed protein product [Spirodela intermedia]|uniref:Uncharacterized protein n=2 Tax=Spirodela intermedia TaxID=51605 RepID=A0A7I8KIV0_SPIIN|nr:unnamed protein product [Spirodela intermedia]CAA6660838.1 unnamed protein product [Spirodela intermedia]CAA7397196.1 unnamed protein product [Spirodela intermedia]